MNRIRAGVIAVALATLAASVHAPTAGAISNRYLTTAMFTNVFGGGRVAAAAGDVNGDGYPDVIVSRANTEIVSLFFGGPDADGIPDVSYAGGQANEFFGGAVAGIGDLNGDGYADVAIGARWNDAEGTDAGHVYVYLGARFPDGVADRVLSLRVAGYEFGSALDGAGDVNGDGYSDMVVSSLDCRYSPTGHVCSEQAWVYFGSASPDTTVDVRLQGTQEDIFGTSVRGAGDVNGDGYDDVVVGAPAYGYGYAYVFYGGAVMNGAPDLVYRGQTLTAFQFEGYGITVAPAGDLNGDGYADVAVCDPRNPTGGGDAGRVFVYFGGGSPDTTADLVLTGESGGDFLGSSAGAAGDVDGDGYDDFIVGANGIDFGTSPWTGGVYIYRGGPGVSAVPSITLVPALEYIREFGYAVDGVGDFDGDGRDDVLLSANVQTYIAKFFPYEVLSPRDGDRWVAGAPETVRWRGHDLADLSISVDGGVTWSVLARGVGGRDENELRVLAPGVATDHARIRLTYTGQAPSRATAEESGGVLRIVNPTIPTAVATRTQRYFYNLEFGDMLGYSVAGGGDANGDGFEDLFVGSPFRGDAGAEAGAVFVYLGGPGADESADAVTFGPAAGERLGMSVAFVGDVNGDGIDDRIAGSLGTASTPGNVFFYYGGGTPPDPGADFTFTGEGWLDMFGSSAAGAGDVNGDGFADIIVGAAGFDAPPAMAEAGRAYLFLGGPGFDVVPDLVLTGTAAGDAFGSSVCGAGDFNGDGYGDFIVGAPGYDAAAAADVGRAYVYLGGAALDGTADVVIDGFAAGDGFASVVSGIGDIDGDHYGDVAIAATGNDAGGTDAGRVYVYLGSRVEDRLLPITPDLMLTGESDYDQLGSIGNVGDVNRDGFDDLALGSAVNGVGGPLAGRAYVFFGGTRPDASPDIVLTGEGSFGHFGGSIAGSDFNGDGFPDLAVGVPASFNQGAGYVSLHEIKRYLFDSPVAGDTWNVGAMRTVTWRGAEPANLLLSTDGGITYEQLESNVGGKDRNVFSLRVPHRPTRFARLRVAPVNSAVPGTAESDSFFTINVSVELLSMLAAPMPGGGIELSWSTSPGPEDLRGYRIERAEGEPANDGWRTLASLTRETRYADPDGQPGARYRIYAVNGFGDELLVGETAVPRPRPLAAWPLPFRGDALNVSFVTQNAASGAKGMIEVGLFDVNGRLVRWLARGPASDGLGQAVWDGRDERGQTAPNGIYFLRAKVSGRTSIVKVPVLR